VIGRVALDVTRIIVSSLSASRNPRYCEPMNSPRPFALSHSHVTYNMNHFCTLCGRWGEIFLILFYFILFYFILFYFFFCMEFLQKFNTLCNFPSAKFHTLNQLATIRVTYVDCNQYTIGQPVCSFSKSYCLLKISI